jgi:hypothetical protein
MKKLLFFSIIVLMTTAVFAQFTIGPKVGFTMSKLNVSGTVQDFTQEAKAGWQIGAFARFGKKLYLQPELMFTTSGGILYTEGDELKTKVTLNNIQVPVMLGFKLINLKIVNVRIMGGPAISFVTNTEISSDQHIENPLAGEDIKSANWSAQLGFGVDVLMFALDVRYEWGLSNIYDPPAGDPSGDMKSNLWNVSLGWKIF